MKKLVIIIFFLVSAIGSSQAEEVRIPWMKDKELGWQDFQGKPDPNLPFHANTSSGISFGWSLKTSGDSSEFNYDVSNNFYPGRSWVKGKKGSPELLVHEQLHFDISELFARKLRQKLSTYRLGPEVKKELILIYEAHEQQRQKMQASYDLESDHGLRKEAQEKWEAYVKLELQKLIDFAL